MLYSGKINRYILQGCCLLLILLCEGCNDKKTNTTYITNLRCEYLINPLGIDAAHPRLSWELQSDERNKQQSAYQVLVASDSALLSEEKADLWNSGKINSNRTNQIPYAGISLHSENECYWKVKIWDEKGSGSNWSAAAYWSMGLLAPRDWKSKWIGAAKEIVPRSKQYYSGYGYHSDTALVAGTVKWIIIDLQETKDIDAIKLYPAQHDKTYGYLFPVRFRVDVSDDPIFNDFESVVDETGGDYKNAGAHAYSKSFPVTRARYVRLLVSRLAKIDSVQYAFAVAEMEVLCKGKNFSMNKPVKALDYLIHGYWSPGNWKRECLTDGFIKPNSDHVYYSLKVPPSPLLRREFIITKKVKKAYLYATAAGLYEIYMNGKKAGNQVLAPEWTNYNKRFQYQVYNVTRLLQQGGNAIAAILADGWYAGAIFSHPDRGSYGFDRRLKAQLIIHFEDGSKQVIGTDETWKMLDKGPIVEASLYDGEVYDARLVIKDWDLPAFNDGSWSHVTIDTIAPAILSAQVNEPVTIIREIKPQRFFKTGKNVYIFDMGQNMAGWCRLSLSYNPGKKIILRHAEVLNDDTTIYTENLRHATQTDIYIPGNEPRIDYEPRFTYHGFRYVEVTGLSQTPDLQTVIGCVVASSSPVAGHFETSDSDINKLWSNILWTQLDNMPSVPTDCPQRDERAGWMGDAQVFSQTAIYNLDMAGFFSKWTGDIDDSQLDDGRFPDYSPQVGDWMSFYNSPGWADAGTIVPWRMYENYGDTVVLARHYAAMKKFIDFLSLHNPDLIWTKYVGNMYGDWLNGNTIVSPDYPKEGGQVPNDVYATAFFAYSTAILAKTARLLNKQKDKEYYDSLANAIKHAFGKQFIDSDGKIKGNTQAGYALALEFDLVPPSLIKRAAGHMAKAVADYDYRISTGIQSTIRLMNQLSANGYSDIAYRLLKSRRFPSWLYSIDQGATTIWERWDGYVQGRGFQDKGMNSFNHYAIGAVGEWMYRYILGINNDVDNPGYRNIIIHPVPGGNIHWAKGTYHSIAGEINVSWKKDDSTFNVEISIPMNTTATVILPSGKEISEGGKLLDETGIIKKDQQQTCIRVGSGTYHFKISL